MSFDGQEEIDEFERRLKTLVGGRVTQGIADAAQHQRTMTASVRPYITWYTLEPIALAGARTFSDTARTIPYMLPFVLSAHSGEFGQTRDTIRAARSLLLGVELTPTSTELETVGEYGDSRTRLIPGTTPSRWSGNLYLRCRINTGI